MSTTTGLGALPTLEAMSRTTNTAQTDTSAGTQASLTQGNTLDTTQQNQMQTMRGNTLDTTQQNALQNQTMNQAGSQMNQFTAGQQALQNQVLGMGGGMLAGNFSTNFAMPQQWYDAQMRNFARFSEPKLAAQHGAGSPAIQAARDNFQLHLAAQGMQNMFQNQLSAYDAAGRYAFTPMGSNTLQSGAQQQNSAMNQTQAGQNNQTQNSSMNQTQSGMMNQAQNTANQQVNNRVASTNEMQLNSGMDMSVLWEWLNGGAAAPTSPAGGAGGGGFRSPINPLAP